ncbi:hypothetical protein JX266_001593 [Neoarthrinium moseri]|nr:hypothetical protein JX266_001593 [Neoarthrinium moseri]
MSLRQRSPSPRHTPSPRPGQSPRESPPFREAAGQQNSTSVRSLTAFGRSGGENIEDGGAEIPDIPPQQRASAEEPKARMVTPEPQELYVPAGSRSPSTVPKSLLSKSSNSHLNSSASSLLPQSGQSALPALQTRAIQEHDGLEPLAEEEIDPSSFDLVVPAHALGKQYSLETQSELLFSAKHLEVMFEDPLLLQRFTNFIYLLRPQSIPILEYYMDTLKALRAIDYANAVVDGLVPVQGLDYTSTPVNGTFNQLLREKAAKAFETLANQEMPAFITHTYIQTVSLTIKRRIADTLPPELREMSEGLAEVFCLTDPSRPDNPIVFASEEFHKTTQYGMSYVLGRNCRFLQGPKTNPFSVRRIREKLDAGKEHCETFLNYRRDGSPFMNLLMVAPLYDSRGVVRYHIGAQVDVSGLVRDCSGLESLERLVERETVEGSTDGFVRIHRKNGQTNSSTDAKEDEAKKDEFRELASMFSLQELKTVRESGGSMHRVHQSEAPDTEGVSNWHKPRLLIRDDATIDRRDSDPVLQYSPVHSSASGKLAGVYEHYLLVRPYPSLRILFASPSLRVPGMLQSNLMSRIGGSSKVREAIAQAFADGHGVTAKVRWLKSRADAEGGRARWIHCTPLLGSNGAVGVWMVVLVDDEQDSASRAPRDAPPVDRHIRGLGRREFAGSVDEMSLDSFAGVGAGSIGGESDGRFSMGGRDPRVPRTYRNDGDSSSSRGHRRTPALNGLAMHATGHGSCGDGGPATPNTARFDSL